jgi:hypothetical protein
MELFLNGIDVETGSYLTPGITTEMVARLARGQSLEGSDLRDVRMRRSLDAMTQYQMGVGEGIDPNDLSQAGWSIIFPSSLPPKELDAILEALQPLLDLRKAQAKSLYKEALGENGYRRGETKNDFLKRFGRGPGVVKPDKFPYYALIVADPKDIPFSFQYQLDIQYAVGRIHFEHIEDYHRYAVSVIRAEQAEWLRPKKATFFGVANPEDAATALSARHLVSPLAESLQAAHRDWEIDLFSPQDASKANLEACLGGEDTPALLFNASHGLAFPLDDPRQLRHQGALLCQDWPGPKARVPISEAHYYSADDLSSQANISGMVAFLFACYGGGTPRTDNFYHLAFGKPRQIAPYDFIAQLPRRMLSHPNGGALAVFAHVERAWLTSVLWDQTIRDIETFENAIKALLNGKTAGNASEYFNTRYAELSADLAAELEHGDSDDEVNLGLTGMWASRNDSRNFILFGDPAVRLCVAGSGN